jgi:hypothetical protein
MLPLLKGLDLVLSSRRELITRGTQDHPHERRGWGSRRRGRHSRWCICAILIIILSDIRDTVGSVRSVRQIARRRTQDAGPGRLGSASGVPSRCRPARAPRHPGRGRTSRLRTGASTQEDGAVARPDRIAAGSAGWPNRRRPTAVIRELLAPDLTWSGWRDLNPRPLAPKASALPSCATPRTTYGDEPSASAVAARSRPVVGAARPVVGAARWGRACRARGRRPLG